MPHALGVYELKGQKLHWIITQSLHVAQHTVLIQQQVVQHQQLGRQSRLPLRHQTDILRHRTPQQRHTGRLVHRQDLPLGEWFIPILLCARLGGHYH